MDNKPSSDHSSESEDDNPLPLNTQQSYITDPQEYLNFALKDKKIKVMDECNPIFPNIYLKDISLHKKGPLEDKIYSKVNKYYINIRRGNTLCQIYHPQQLNNKQQSYDLFFCRRGMKKFYDLQPDYLKVSANLSTHHRLMRNRIFQLLEADLETVGSVYHLYCLFKENGQHCQISYVKVLDSWLFASKNVAILAKTPQDLQKHYHKQRFYWAKLIGIQFFKTLQKMSKEQQQCFKQDINGYTLLGQHCGNEQHQHITKYDSVQIIFYGLVDNTGFDHCQPVEQCRQLLHKYGLKMSRCKERKNLTDKNKIFSSMWEMLKEVAEGTMAKEGEGSVMYIVAEREGKQRTIGMCKLKTCEYLIYRKLREMLKLNVARKGMTANSFQKYKFEVEQLVQHYFKPPKSLQFYFQLGEQAFKQCGNNAQISETYLRYKFVDFISKFEQQHKTKPVSLTSAAPKRVILVCLPRLSNSIEKYCKANQFQVDYMYRAGKPLNKTTIHILYLIPRLPQPLEENCTVILPQYTQQQIKNCIEQLQNCKDLTKSQLITFIKSEDKAKSVLMLQEKIQHFRKNCKQAGVNLLQGGSKEEQLVQAIQSIFSKTQSQQSETVHEGQKYRKHIILPLLIPGSGKSTLSKQIMTSKHSKYVWKRIDSDKMRRELMELKDKVDLDDEVSNRQLFIETKEQALQKFREELVKQIEKQPTCHQCVFVDRIYSPYNIEETIETILNCQKEYTKIHILTQNFQQIKLNDKTYPYSLHYVLTCLKRCLERSDHQTMPNDPYAVAKIVMKFYQMMGNFNYKSIAKLSPQKINLISLPLIEQSEQTKCVNQVLKKKVEECLNLVQPGREAKDNSCFIELVEGLYKFGEFKDNKDLGCYVQLALSLQKAIQSSE